MPVGSFRAPSFFLIATAAFAAESSSSGQRVLFGENPSPGPKRVEPREFKDLRLRFEANAGQAPSDAKFTARAGGLSIALLPQEVAIHAPDLAGGEIRLLLVNSN